MVDTVTSERPRCSCGHDRNHHMVSPDPVYTLTGSFWVAVFGVSTKPIRIKFRCRRCNETFEESEEPALLDSFI